MPDQKNLFAAVIFLFGIFGVALAYPINNGLPGDVGDSRFNLYILEHFYLALTGQVENFVDGGFFYPLTKTILFSDNHWGSGLIYSYFRFFDATPIEAFFYWFLVGFILNYWLAFYVSRKFELSELAAAIGAFLFAFGLPVIAQDGHVQLIYRPFVPLAFLAFFYYTKSRNFYHLALAALAVSSQFLISVYSGFFLALSLGAWALVEMKLSNCWLSLSKPTNIYRGNFLSRNLPLVSTGSTNGFLSGGFLGFFHGIGIKKSLPILALALATFLLFALPYFAVKNLYHFGRSALEIAPMLPRIESYFLADRSNLWFDDLAIFSQLPGRWEHQMFIGIGAFAALLFLYFRKNLIEKNSLAQKFSLILLVMILLSLSINSISLYYLIVLIPGGSSLRAISREILVLLFPISYLVGYSLDKIRSTNFATLSSRAIVCLICFLIVIDPIFANKSISKTKDWDERLKLLESRISKSDKEIDSDSILILSTKTIEEELDAMLAAQKLKIKTINGYSGNTPKAPWYFMNDCAAAKTRIQDLEEVAKQTNQNYKIHREKIVAIGFDKECVL